MISRLDLIAGFVDRQIAARLGGTDMKNLARYFKQDMGMTPLQYRKRHWLD